MGEPQHTIASLLQWARTSLNDAESPNDARLLLCHVLDVSLTHLMTWPDEIVGAEHLGQYQALIEKRKQGWPVAYLTGHRAFWSFELDVNPSTLIPRPETELLVELSLELTVSDNASVLDLGTGTGAIALALSLERPSWSVSAADKQSDAVSLARHNAQRLGVNNIEVLQSDWFSAFADRQFDIIVSNPPYVEDDSIWLSQGDVRFEPRSALTSGDDGLDDIRHIISDAVKHLKSGGWLLLEHGFEQAAATTELFRQAGFCNIATHQDLAGLDRVTLAQISHHSE